MRQLTIVLFLGIVVSQAAVLQAAGPAESEIRFVEDVRPILKKHCYTCHGPNKQKSSLRLDIKSEAFKGGESYGPSIVPGKAEESPLIEFVSDPDADLPMPPDGDRLSPQEIATLTRWVESGAVWPDGVDTAKLVDKRDHWSFKPIRRPKVPTVPPGIHSRNAIDAFVFHRLRQAGLAPSPEADRLVWLRRVYFDLIGLPPTPKQIDTFINDRRDGAHDRVVNQLLASPRYGERWAQHWLDVVRYADTHGFEVNTPRKNAWPYRDYVIAAFNQDTPYDQFVRQQLAGEAMGEPAATGFLVTAAVLLPGQIGKDQASMRLARQDELGEIVINTGGTFLGLSIGCARCHDHKFDPLTMHDYYSMQAFFSGVQYGDRPIDPPDVLATRKAARHKVEQQLAQIESALTAIQLETGKKGMRPPTDAKMNIESFAPVMAKRLRFVILSTNNLEPCIDELEVFNTDGVNVGLARRGAKPTASGSKVAPNRHELRFVNDGQYGNSRSWMSSEVGKGWVALEFPEEEQIEKVVWGRDREGKFTDRLAGEYRIEIADATGPWRTVADSSNRQAGATKLNAESFSLAGLKGKAKARAEELLAKRKLLQTRLTDELADRQVYAGVFQSPQPVHILHRGDPEQPRDEVAPSVPTALGSLKLDRSAGDAERRAALADWIVDRSNPLTARVMVNRIWQGHFGIGLVETSNDFGRSGTLPSHPELLDWLATEFIESGWSVKHMHRLIVLSATYRQSSRINPEALAHDADSRLLWRFPSRRLSAETIRDSILSVSGRLNLKSGGPGFDLFRSRGGLSGFPPIETFTGDGLRRMIYAHKIRMERDIVFGAFDCPDAGRSTDRRRQSTTPIQALNLFNSRFTIDATKAFAARIRNEAAQDSRSQVRRAYQLALGRLPEANEVADAVPVVQAHGLETLCRALFNCNEFLFLP